MEHAPDADPAAVDRAALARTIMRRQATIGLRVAAVFVLILIGLPLLNLYAPGLMAAQVGGFSLAWLLLAVLFYPVTWFLSWAFVRGSDRIEAQIIDDYRLTIEDSRRAIPQAPPQDQAAPKRKLFVGEEDEA